MNARNDKLEQIKAENKSLKEANEILANTQLMSDIKKSLKQIYKGESIPLSKFSSKCFFH